MTPNDALATLVTRWLDQYPSENTRKAYARGIRRLWTVLPEGAEVVELTTADLKGAARKWAEARERQNPASFGNALYNQTVASWNSFFKFLWEEEVIRKRPQSLKERPLPTITPRPIPTPSEVEKVWRLLLSRRPEAFDEATALRIREDRLLFALCVGGGLRRAELRRLRKRDVDTERLVFRVHGKRDKERFVALEQSETVTDIVMALLNMKPSDDDRLFTNTTNGHPISERGINQRIQYLFHKAGCSSVYTSHGLRAYMATHALARGVESSLVQRQLGHSSFTTTQRYHPLQMRIVPVGNLGLPKEAT